MKKVYPKIYRESWKEQETAGRYNPALKAKYGNFDITLGAGNSDDLFFWKNKEYFYCLSINTRMPYIGLEEFNFDNQLTANIFLQVDYEQEEILGKKWEDKSPAWLFRVLSNYLD